MSRSQLEIALDALRESAPAVPSDPKEADLAPWRARIDLIDRVVLYLLNQRSDCANAIGHIKKALSMPVYVPSREAEVLKNVRERNPGPLPDDAVVHLFERIIDETRSLERRRYQDESSQGEE